MIRSLLTASVLLALAVPSSATTDDRTLIASAAANRAQQGAPAAEQPEEGDLNTMEREARIDYTLSQARLELILARKAIKRSRWEEAARRAVRVRQRLAELPQGVDAGAYELQAEGILSKAAKAGVDVAALEAGPSDLPPADDYLDVQAEQAARIGRRYAGADTPDIHTTRDAQTLRQRTLERQAPTDYGYRPVRELIDVDALREMADQQIYYQSYLQGMYRNDELRRFIEADEARVGPADDVEYPDDWPERVARRQQYEGGQIARSDSWTDQEGREWFVAIYDLHDLIYVPPDFQVPAGISLAEDIRVALDRAALRDRSFIFGGYPEDLAAGIPLLRYFGGIDDFAYRGPKYDYERQQQIVEMMRAFTERQTEAKIISLPPTNP